MPLVGQRHFALVGQRPSAVGRPTVFCRWPTNGTSDAKLDFLPCKNARLARCEISEYRWPANAQTPLAGQRKMPLAGQRKMPLVGQRDIHPRNAVGRPTVILIFQYPTSNYEEKSVAPSGLPAHLLFMCNSEQSRNLAPAQSSDSRWMIQFHDSGGNELPYPCATAPLVAMVAQRQRHPNRVPPRTARFDLEERALDGSYSTNKGLSKARCLSRAAGGLRPVQLLAAAYQDGGPVQQSAASR